MDSCRILAIPERQACLIPNLRPGRQDQDVLARLLARGACRASEPTVVESLAQVATLRLEPVIREVGDDEAMRCRGRCVS